jgi:hypothetical protein
VALLRLRLKEEVHYGDDYIFLGAERYLSG